MCDGHGDVSKLDRGDAIVGGIAETVIGARRRKIEKLIESVVLKPVCEARMGAAEGGVHSFVAVGNIPDGLAQ
jgi:hypothetical protein